MAVPRSPPLLPVALAVLLVTTGTAFGLTFSTQLEWQQRDAVSATVTDLALVEAADDGHAVTAEVAVVNPLSRPVGVSSIRLLVFEGTAPPAVEDRLSVPRSASNERSTVPAGERVTVSVRADVRPEDVERLRRAIESGRANSQGLLTLTFSGREFEVDVE